MNVKVLTIDDQTNVLKMLTVSLTQFGHHVNTAETYDAAMEKLTENEYDIILADKNFPGRDGELEGGMALLKYVKTQFPETEVIMMTGFATIDTAIEAMKLGAFDYVRKPFSIHEINEKIERVMVYKSFINPPNAIKTYKNLHNNILGLIGDKENLPGEEVHKLINTLDTKIDMLFKAQKERERIIINQKEALGKISFLAGQIIDELEGQDVAYGLVKQIYEESKKRI